MAFVDTVNGRKDCADIRTDSYRSQLFTLSILCSSELLQNVRLLKHGISTHQISISLRMRQDKHMINCVSTYVDFTLNLD